MGDGPKCHQFFASFIASVGAINAGSCISWINYEEREKAHQREEGVGHFSFEFINFFLVASFAAFISSFLLRWRGPLLALKIGALLTFFVWVIAWWLFTFTCHYPFHTTMYLFALMCGLNTASISLYVGEIAQKEVRGACASLLSLNFKIGTLIADMTFELHEPKTLCYIFMGIFFFQTLMLFKIYEAPFFLLISGKDEDIAIEALNWLRGEEYDTLTELHEINVTIYRMRKDGGMCRMFLRCFQCWKIWLIILGVEFFHQFTGATLAILVANHIFERSTKGVPAYVCDLVIGTLQICTIFLSMAFVDKIGRRPLLVCSSIGIVVAAMFVGIHLRSAQYGWSLVIELFFYLTMFAFGYGPILWVLIAELFPPNLKILACPFAVAMFWILRISIDSINQFFKLMNKSEIDSQFGYVFIFFAFTTFFGSIFTIFFIPETKKKTFAEIQENFQ